MNRPIPFDPSITGIYPKDWNIFPIIKPKPEKKEQPEVEIEDDNNIETPQQPEVEIEDDN